MSTITVAAPKSGAKNDFVVSAIIGVALTALSYAVGLHFGWESHLNWLEIFSVFTSYSCTWLCVKERRINYPIGAVSTAALCVLFWHQGLIGSSILNAYLTPSLLYGWIRWRKDSETRPVTFVGWKWWPVYIGVSVAAYFGALQIIHLFGGTMALMDAFILVGSIMAQFMLDNKKWENWAVWLVVDILAVYEYLHTGLYLVGFQFIFFLINTFIGMYAWGKSRREVNRESRSIDDRIATNEGAPSTHSIRPSVESERAGSPLHAT